MYKRKDATKNRKRLKGKGEIFSPFVKNTTELVELVSNMKELIEVANRSYKQAVQEYAVLTKENMKALRCIVNFSGEQLKTLETLLKSNSFGVNADAIKKVLLWERRSNPNRSKTENERTRNYGYAELFVRGAKEFPDIQDFEHCSLERIKELEKVPDSYLKTMAWNYLKGRKAALKGTSYESFFKLCFYELGVTMDQTVSINGSVNTFDLSDKNRKCAIEISYPNATGSSISQKIGRLHAEEAQIRNLNKDIHLYYVGGGPGLTGRASDLKNLANSMDFCFGATTNEAVDFLHCCVNKTLGIKTNKKKITQIISGLSEEM